MRESFHVPYTALACLEAGRVAVLAPHADDEVFGCGGTLALLVERQVPVSVAVVSSGADAEVRRGESLCAARILGYDPPAFWDLEDGGVVADEALVRRIVLWLKETGADLLLAPSLWEMHRDHRAVCEAAMSAVVEIGESVRLAMYEVGVPLEPGALVDISSVFARKQEAIGCFGSQLKRQNYGVQNEGLNRFRTYTLPQDVEAAEAFLVLTADDLAQQDLGAYVRGTTRVARAAEDAVLAAQDRAAAAEARAVRLAEALAPLERRAQALAERERTLAVRLAEVEQSRSWRLTAPLRSFAARARRVREAARSPGALLLRVYHWLPLPPAWKRAVATLLARTHSFLLGLVESPNEQRFWELLLERRTAMLALGRAGVSWVSASPADHAQPPIDVTVVTHNSAKWVDVLVDSLLEQAYPTKLISLIFVDSASTDDTLGALQRLQESVGERFARFIVQSAENRGFGAGHNAAAALGMSPYILVTNPDLRFTRESIARVVSVAQQDDATCASWELRQKPYEHPKHYDPVTGETGWSSHACVLLRRDVFEKVRGYDERIFLYGEDVEFSYRLREAGYVLRYVPSAVVWHDTYAVPGERKPAQYVGSVTANLFLRTRYGRWRDVLMIPALAVIGFLRAPSREARAQLWRRLDRGWLRFLPALLRERGPGRNRNALSFIGFDYGTVRSGAFWASRDLPDRLPRVSVVTRTYAGRSWFLHQAGLTVLNQTYPNLEWVVVEDGGRTQESTVERLARQDRVPVKYVALPKVGRAEAGNRGLEHSDGELLLFLDDDDLLYADHVETLVAAIEASAAAAAYALAWEVPTWYPKEGQAMREMRYILRDRYQQPFDPAVLQIYNYIPIQSILFRRELYDQRGGFDPTLEELEDWNLWLRYAAGNTFEYVPKLTSMYRVSAEQDLLETRQRKLDRAYADAKRKAAESIASLLAVSEPNPKPPVPLSTVGGSHGHEGQ